MEYLKCFFLTVFQWWSSFPGRKGHQKHRRESGNSRSHCWSSTREVDGKTLRSSCCSSQWPLCKGWWLYSPSTATLESKVSVLVSIMFELRVDRFRQQIWQEYWNHASYNSRMLGCFRDFWAFFGIHSFFWLEKAMADFPRCTLFIRDFDWSPTD